MFAAGAANYGADTQSNILENTWGNKWVQLCINLSIASAALSTYLELAHTQHVSADRNPFHHFAACPCAEEAR